MNTQEEVIAIKDIMSVLSLYYAQENPHEAFKIGRFIEGMLLSDKMTHSSEFKELALHVSQNLLGNLDQPLFGNHLANRATSDPLKPLLD